jgi:AcrR family transcriptional regulator
MQDKEVTSSHDRILQAAKHLFAQRGYENTSTIMIARAASTSESQLVKHFGSKSGLLEAIFDHGWREMGNLLEGIIDDAPPVERLRFLGERVLAGLNRDPEMKELMLFESRRIRNQGNTVLLTASFIEFVRKLDLILEDIHERGELRPDFSPQVVRSALIGACEGMLRDELLARRQGVACGYSGEDIKGVLELFLLSLLVPEQALRTAPTPT